MAGACTRSFFEIRGGTVQPRLQVSRFVLSNYNVEGLYSPTLYILLYFSITQWPKNWIECTTFRLCVWQSALHHRGKQCHGVSSTVPTLIQLHLLQGRRAMIRTMVQSLVGFRIWVCTSFHKTIWWSKIKGQSAALLPRNHHRTRKRKVYDRFNFFDRLRTIFLLKNWEDLFCSLAITLLKWPF